MSLKKQGLKKLDFAKLTFARCLPRTYGSAYAGRKIQGHRDFARLCERAHCTARRHNARMVDNIMHCGGQYAA